MAYKVLTTFTLEIKDDQNFKYEIILNCLTAESGDIEKDYEFVINSLSKGSTKDLTIQQIADIIMKGTTTIDKCEIRDKLDKTPLTYLTAERIKV